MAGCCPHHPGFWLDDASFSHCRCFHWIGAVHLLLRSVRKAFSRGGGQKEKEPRKKIRLHPVDVGFCVHHHWPHLISQFCSCSEFSCGSGMVLYVELHWPRMTRPNWVGGLVNSVMSWSLIERLNWLEESPNNHQPFRPSERRPDDVHALGKCGNVDAQHRLVAGSRFKDHLSVRIEKRDH